MEWAIGIGGISSALVILIHNLFFYGFKLLFREGWS
jgi:hypothetical protein